MRNVTCSVDDCDKPARGRYCSMHSERLRVHGSLEKPPKPLLGKARPGFEPKHPPVCTVEDCEKKSFLRGWCRMHYERWRAGGEPAGPIKEVSDHTGKKCAVDNCDRDRKKRLWCRAHYQRWALTGEDPNNLEPLRPPRLEVVTYFTLHQRLAADMGKAIEHRCVDCGKGAHHWSYDHLDPDELVCERTGLVYSLDPSHYSPRCRSCHAIFDGVQFAHHRDAG